MKWKIYSIPETIKIITCKKIMNTDKYQYQWSNIPDFISFIQKRLNTLKKIEVDKEYKFMIPEKENSKAIIEFARFCVNLHNNPFGKCEYMEIFNGTKMPNGKSLAETFNIQKGLSNEVFLATTVTGDTETNKEELKVIAFTVTGVSYRNEKYVKIAITTVS